MTYLPILLTASISTRGMVGACFTDEERYGMYLMTLHHYISEFFIKTKDRINTVKLVFAENSGWDLTQLKNELADAYSLEMVEKNIEFISLAPELFDISYGKGYNELLMINLAVESSLFIKNSGAFFKVTGRYPIYNLEYFHKTALNAFNRHFNFYCDVKDHNLYRLLGLNWNSHSFEARLWAAKTDFYKSVVAPEYVNCFDYDGRFVESVLFDKLNKLTNKFKSLNTSDIIEGGGESLCDSAENHHLEVLKGAIPHRCLSPKINNRLRGKSNDLSGIYSGFFCLA